MNSDQLNTVTDWPSEPISLFNDWFDYAKAQDVPEPEAMTICSCTADGKPSARMVLLRGIDENGFRFYTNYQSRKSEELIANPHAALVFYWREVYLQVRIEGTVEKVSAEDSDAYFNARPRANRISAVVSDQSKPIDDFRDLVHASEELLNSDTPVPRPQHWGGFLIRPTVMEFWAGTQTRMHRRCVYTLGVGSWTRELIAP
jgi:pyridoxamine 5'-phosphate oxidase